MNNNILNTYQKLTGKLSYALLLLTVIALPFPRYILQPIAVVWIISWVLEGRFLRKENWKWQKTAMPAVLLLALTLWEAVSLLWCPNVGAGMGMIEKHWPYIILLLIPILGVNAHIKADKMLSALFKSCVVSVCVYAFTHYWVWNYDAVIWFRPDLLKEAEWPSFHGITSIIKHRNFYCMILMLSMFSTPLLYQHYRKEYEKWEVLLTLGIGNLIMLAGMLLTGSRSALLMLAIGGLYLLFINYRHRLAWWKQVIISAIVVGSCITAFLMNPRFSMLTSIDYQNIRLSEASEMNEPRPFIWHTVLSHADEYPFFGLGAGQHRDFLSKQYEASGNQLFIDLNYGTHNEYFSYWMCLGPLAVLLLTAAFLMIPRVYRGAARLSAHAVSIIFLLGMFSDDLLERMDGILILIVWMILLHIIETTFPSSESGK